MIQNQSKIVIKDTSGVKNGRIIAVKTHGRVGGLVKMSIISGKRKVKKKTNLLSMLSPSRRSELQHVLIIQTKAPINRLDGSSVKFDCNVGVTVNFSGKKGGKLDKRFKRIKTVVPLEIKKLTKDSNFVGNYNLAKLGRRLI